MGAQSDQDKISAMLSDVSTGLAGLSAWSRVVRHQGKTFVAVDNTKGSNDQRIVALRQLIVKVCVCESGSK